MDLNYTINYTFNPENITSVMPYNQDLIITLLLFIAFCEGIRTIFLIGEYIKRMYGVKK